MSPRVFRRSLEIPRRNRAKPSAKIFIPFHRSRPVPAFLSFLLSPPFPSRSRPPRRSLGGTALRTFETPVSYQVNYWLLGYSPVRVAPRPVRRYNRRGRDDAAYRNSQFARAFTFEFPLFTFRIVVPHARGNDDRLSRDPTTKSFVVSSTFLNSC